MESEEIERLSESSRCQHLSEATLVSYRDNCLDTTRAVMAAAHLELCLVCQQRLKFLADEADAVANYVMSDDDQAAFQQTLSKLKQAKLTASAQESALRVLKSNITNLLDLWMVFAHEATSPGESREEVWRAESEDGLLTAWVVMDHDSGQTLHFSSPELACEGAQLRFRLGPFKTKVAFQLEGESAKVVADISIPSEQLKNDGLNFSLEILTSSATN